MGRWFSVLAGGALVMAAACSQGSAPAKNPGDDLTVDVEASTTMPSQPDAADYDDGFFNGTDGPYGSGYGTSGPPVITICPPSDGGDGSAGDGGAASDATVYASQGQSSGNPYGDAGSTGAYGSGASTGPCTPIPAACASQPNCTCFLTVLKSSLSCTYPHCDDGMSAGFSIYCP
jgi:hypothetical protein